MLKSFEYIKVPSCQQIDFEEDKTTNSFHEEEKKMKLSTYMLLLFSHTDQFIARPYNSMVALDK